MTSPYALRYDDTRQADGYARARAIPAETTAQWMRTFAAHAPARRPLSVLDLGSGTGRFTPALAETFGGPVWGVEPSDRMRAVAEAESAAEGVRYLAGQAEAIPLADASIDLALMFLSFHHVRDRAAAAAEIRRVLKPGGRLFVRSVFSDRMPDLKWHAFFPRAREIEQVMFPTLTAVEEAFHSAGFETLALVTVEEQVSASLAESAERLRLRSISTFEHMDEAEIEAGLTMLDAAVAAGEHPGPVVIDSDLLVLAPH